MNISRMSITERVQLAISELKTKNNIGVAKILRIVNDGVTKKQELTAEQVNKVLEKNFAAVPHVTFKNDRYIFKGRKVV